MEEVTVARQVSDISPTDHNEGYMSRNFEEFSDDQDHHSVGMVINHMDPFSHLPDGDYKEKMELFDNDENSKEISVTDATPTTMHISVEKIRRERVHSYLSTRLFLSVLKLVTCPSKERWMFHWLAFENEGSILRSMKHRIKRLNVTGRAGICKKELEFNKQEGIWERPKGENLPSDERKIESMRRNALNIFSKMHDIFPCFRPFSDPTMANLVIKNHDATTGYFLNRITSKPFVNTNGEGDVQYSMLRLSSSDPLTFVMTCKSKLHPTVANLRFYVSEDDDSALTDPNGTPIPVDRLTEYVAFTLL